MAEVLWELPDHTVGKHDVIVAYLKAWLPILGQGFGKAVVVDGFAGPGEYKGGEPGSPLLSWRVAGEHKAAGRLGQADLDFRFVDSDPKAVAHLRSLLTREQLFDGMSSPLNTPSVPMLCQTSFLTAALLELLYS